MQDILMSAFKALDAEGRGYIESERMRELLCGMGAPAFREKEFDAFLKAAGDRTDSTKIFYEDYCAIMTR
jgi:Ca2+-binding EF-hand superfamily protein